MLNIIIIGFRELNENKIYRNIEPFCGKDDIINFISFEKIQKCDKENCEKLIASVCLNNLSQLLGNEDIGNLPSIVLIMVDCRHLYCDYGIILNFKDVRTKRNGELSRVGISIFSEYIKINMKKTRFFSKKMAKYLTERDSKTSYLLPIENFKINSYKKLIMKYVYDIEGLIYNLDLKKDEEIFENDVLNKRDENIKSRIEVNVLGGKTRFIGKRKIQFVAPCLAGARHGKAEKYNPPHNELCLLRGRFRFGVAYHPKFHYDCYKASGNISGSFVNCHGEELGINRMKKIDISPNDNIRNYKN